MSQANVSMQKATYSALEQKGERALPNTITSHYPPSTTEVANLKPISTSELRLETRHVGRVLIVRTFGELFCFTYLHSCIEDCLGVSSMLHVYNSALNEDACYTLPKDTVFAIKEPYFQATGGLGSGTGHVIGGKLRVDHPSDLIKLEPTHPMVPIELASKLLELDTDALVFKSKGNVAFKANDYLRAAEAYTQGLEIRGENDDVLRCDLFRNRAIANIHLQRYERACKDAKAALIPDPEGDETATKNNVKALYRASRALYCMQRYVDAKAQVDKLLELSPGDKDGQDHLEKTEAHLKETETGMYDFVAIREQVSAGIKRLDHADFTQNVAIRATSKKGNGLFATKDIAAGDLTLVEKAFAIVFSSEAAAGSKMNIIIDMIDSKAMMGPQAECYYHAVQKAMHDSEQAVQLAGLYDGRYSPKVSTQQVDGKTVVDTFRIAATVRHNSFLVPDARRQSSNQSQESESCGIWLVTSRFNHSCDANAARAFVGDLVIVRAAKDIAKDAEITIAYDHPGLRQAEINEELGKIWDFKCCCKMCEAEATSPPVQKKARAEFINQIDAYMNDHRDVVKNRSKPAVVATAEKLYTKLDNTYDKKAFAQIPRIALARLST